MSNNKKELIRVRLGAITSAIETADQQMKAGGIVKSTADDLNGILDDLYEMYPGYVNSFPRPIRTMSSKAALGKADASFLDLQIKVNQIVKVLDLIESGDQ